MGHFDQLAGLEESHSKSDVKPLYKALNRLGLNLSIRSGDTRDRETIKRARVHLATAKKLAMGLMKTAESDSSFDDLAGLTEGADRRIKQHAQTAFSAIRFLSGEIKNGVNDSLKQSRMQRRITKATDALTQIMKLSEDEDSRFDDLAGLMRAKDDSHENSQH